MTLKKCCITSRNREKCSKLRRRSGLLSPLLTEQPANNDEKFSQKNDEEVAKNKDEEDTLYQALANNEFLRNVLAGTSLQKLIECMHLKNVNEGDVLLEQGRVNSHLYVSKSGTYEITDDETKKRAETFKDVIRVFGEIAILHSTKARQTVKVVSKGSVWVLDCVKYKNNTINSQIASQDEIVDYLRHVPHIGKASEGRLYRLCNIMTEKLYPGATLMIKEGEVMENFVLVTSGSATILTRDRNRRLDKLTPGCYVGDYIFLKDAVSLHTIIADPPGVECVLLSRKHFFDSFHDLDDFLHGETPIARYNEHLKYERLELKHLKRLKTLGVGGFGKVELVQDTKHKDDIFALKLMKKHEITGQTQIDQVYNEKYLQMACNNDFIVRLYRTFRDTKYIYFLLEPCMGGDLWNLLKRQRRKALDTDSSKFYAGCVLEAFDYLHSKHIVYRDLKPENVMISSNGYAKLTDFGFAKKIGPNDNSYSFVGTSEYVSPELIQNLPHDKGVDYWALGVFIFEMLTGKSPFRNDEHNDLKTYKAILKGIDFVTFPFIVSPRARNLIKKLCRPLSVDRIGCQKNGAKDIQIHPWFSKLDWEKLRRLELEPPIRISLNGKTDTRYFETFNEENEHVSPDFSTWDKDF